jgi:hypothetical protein
LRTLSRSIRDFYLFLCIVTLRPVPLLNEFVQPIQSAVTLTYSPKTAFFLQILIRFSLDIFNFWFCFLQQ